MSLTAVDLSAKLLFAFLNGVCKITFHKNSGVTAEDIKDTIFPDTPLSDVTALIAEYAAVFTHAASQAWAWQEFSEHLTYLGVSSEALPAWDKVWKTEHTHAHAGLVADSVWNTTYEDVSWRVDLLSASTTAAAARAGEEAALPEPVALVQIKTTSASGTPARLTFEADKAKVKELLGTLREIQAVLAERA